MRERSKGALFMIHDIGLPLRGAAKSTSPRTDEENLGSPDAPNRTALD